MNHLSSVAVALEHLSLSLADWLDQLKRRGRLAPMLREAAIERLLLDRAAQAELTVSPKELQQAADAFRRRNGLNSAADTNAWLARNYLSATDFEDALERDLLIEKLQDHLARDRIAAHFEVNRAGYSRAQLRLIQVGREDLARELLAQICEEGRDFGELSREHSLHPSRHGGGRLGSIWRRQMSPPLAEAIFAAREGTVVGPLPCPQGFQLFLVEKIFAPELDAALTASIRQEIFDAWLAEQLAGARLEYPLLEAL